MNENRTAIDLERYINKSFPPTQWLEEWETARAYKADSARIFF